MCILVSTKHHYASPKIRAFTNGLCIFYNKLTLLTIVRNGSIALHHF
jgi:hypothetical protein